MSFLIEKVKKEFGEEAYKKAMDDYTSEIKNTKSLQERTQIYNKHINASPVMKRLSELWINSLSGLYED